MTDHESPKKAVALRYDPEREQAPRVIGKGLGLVAEQIMELAKEHNIPIYEDEDLIEVLAKLDPGEEIPVETYLLVAEILAFIYRANDQAGTPQPSS